MDRREAQTPFGKFILETEQVIERGPPPPAPFVLTEEMMQETERRMRKEKIRARIELVIGIVVFTVALCVNNWLAARFGFVAITVGWALLIGAALIEDIIGGRPFWRENPWN